MFRMQAGRNQPQPSNEPSVRSTTTERHEFDSRREIESQTQPHMHAHIQGACQPPSTQCFAQTKAPFSTLDPSLQLLAPEGHNHPVEQDPDVASVSPNPPPPPRDKTTHQGAEVDIRLLGAVVPQPRAVHPGHRGTEDLRQAAGVEALLCTLAPRHWVQQLPAVS
jgi:hypothetical protein